MLWTTTTAAARQLLSHGTISYTAFTIHPPLNSLNPSREDVQSIDKLSEKMALLQQFIRPENLDIKPVFRNETSWLLAQKELQKINLYKAPRDKLMCILNCCKVINNLLLNVSIASDESPPGADDFLPVLIYVTIKANPPQFHSNLLYIQRYRRQSRLVSEAAYYFTNFLSAESFIWNVDAQSLSIHEVEFQIKMESARAHLLDLSNCTESTRNQTNQEVSEQIIDTSRDTGTHTFVREHYDPPQVQEERKDLEQDQPITKDSSFSSLEEKGATEILKNDQFSAYFEEYPYLFANAGDLTVDDVHSLLDRYKRLVLMYTRAQASTRAEGYFNTNKEFED